MKAQLIGNKKKGLSRIQSGGFATLEILVAFTVLILCTSAVIMIIFGNQSIAVDLETNNEAISKAQTLLEKARADSRFDFNLVNPISPYTPSGNIFTESLDVTQTDLFTKKVTSTVSWQMGGRMLSITLATILTNRDVANSDTCSSVLTGDWSNPKIESTINFSTLSGIPAGTYTLTDLDAYKGKLYMTAGSATNISASKTLPTFFVFDINDTKNPFLIGTADNASTVTSGLNAVRVSEDSTTNKTYAYVASNSASDYRSCNPVSVDPITHLTVIDPACGQFDIFDATNSTPIKTANLKISSTTPVTGQTSNGQVKGSSIFYKKGYVFLGLEKTNGPEFHIIDVHNPESITSGPYTPVGSFEVGHGINATIMRNDYVYLATVNDVSSDKELTILDITNLNNPVSAGDFNSSTGGGNGKSIYVVGNKLYLGKTNGTGFDFHILDNRNPVSTLTQLGGIDIGSGNSVDGVIVRDYLSFLLTNKDLNIFNTSEPTTLTPWGTYTLPGTYNSSNPEPSMDCEGNRIFISSNNEGGQGSIYIIKPGP